LVSLPVFLQQNIRHNLQMTTMPILVIQSDDFRKDTTMFCYQPLCNHYLLCSGVTESVISRPWVLRNPATLYCLSLLIISLWSQWRTSLIAGYYATPSALRSLHILYSLLVLRFLDHWLSATDSSPSLGHCATPIPSIQHYTVMPAFFVGMEHLSSELIYVITVYMCIGLRVPRWAQLFYSYYIYILCHSMDLAHASCSFV
jgi:hypothetical protein